MDQLISLDHRSDADRLTAADPVSYRFRDKASQETSNS